MQGEHPNATGASLVGLLMIVVVLGGLAALGIAGVSSLNDSTDTIAAITNTSTTGGRRATTRTTTKPSSGVPRGIGCTTSADAARAASAVFYATNLAYATRWSDLAASGSPMLVLPSGVTIDAANPNQLDGFGWKLVMTGGGTSDPTFTCQTTAP